MPIFDIKLEDGETIEVEADSEKDIAGLDFADIFQTEEVKELPKPTHAIFDKDLKSMETTLSNVGDTFRNFMIDVEGSASKAKDDGAGNPSIGIGHKLTKSEKKSGILTIGDEGVNFKKGLSDKQINTLFEQDMEPFSDTATEMITQGGLGHVPNIHAALSSLLFNVGVAGFKGSRAHAALLRGDLTTFKREAFDSEIGFVNAGGKPILRTRRAKELQLLDPNRGIERAVLGPPG